MERSKIKVEFNIYSDYIDIDNVTKMMGVNPTLTYLKGDPIGNRPIVRKNALWAIETDYEEANGIDEVLPKVFGLIVDKADIINKVKEQYAAEISIVFVVYIENGENPGMSLDKDFVKFAAEIDARLDFPIYVFGDFDME